MKPKNFDRIADVAIAAMISLGIKLCVPGWSFFEIAGNVMPLIFIVCGEIRAKLATETVEVEIVCPYF